MSIHDLLTSCNGSLLYSATKDAISSPRKRKLTHYTCKKQIIQKSQCAEVRLAKVMFELTKSRYITQNRPERRSQSQCHWYMSWLLHPTAEHQFQSQVSVSSRWYWLDSDTDAARDRSANKRLRLIMLSADVRCRDGHVCVNRCSFFLFFSCRRGVGLCEGVAEQWRLSRAVNLSAGTYFRCASSGPLLVGVLAHHSSGGSGGISVSPGLARK